MHDPPVQGQVKGIEFQDCLTGNAPWRHNGMKTEVGACLQATRALQTQASIGILQRHVLTSALYEFVKTVVG